MNTPLRRDARQINPDFANFVNNEVLPLTSLNKDTFWDDFAKLIDDFSPVNRDLLNHRDNLQKQIDQWHTDHRGQAFDSDAYRDFLYDIGYIVDEGASFTIETNNVDEEISQIAGPQLVVPLKNARFALNAANARWGSLYDALYGSDVIPQTPGLSIAKKHNIARGKHVIQYTKDFLDDAFPLQQGSHRNASAYLIYFNNLLVTFPDGRSTGLKNNRQFVASNGSKSNPESIVLKNNGLHIEIQIDRNGRIGAQDLAGIDDIQVESALSTIMDCEDSVAAVDAEDKIDIYRNWLGLIEGKLTSCFEKNGKKTTRQLNHDKHFTSKEGLPYNLHGRSLLMIRNVGLHMYTDLMKTSNGDSSPEGIIDAVTTALIASLDLQTQRSMPNSQTGSIYIVKPKLHGPQEVGVTCQLFSRIEEMINLERNTLKIGIMDEERRTSLNLKECIRAAKKRVAFINTGFLDRTGDEIHTSMQAGPFLPKAGVKERPWFTAYENNNVDIGLSCGFQGRAQIGKGMWAMPDEMSRMMQEKINHPLSGATTAWVPSPTAATLHALHYHQTNVFSEQNNIRERKATDKEEMLKIPLIDNNVVISLEDVEIELENNIQSILGYMVHWIDQGTGCSKIPDINNIALMEDRATLRISSQHIANWLHHGLCNKDQVEYIMEQMAFTVDHQNIGDPQYRKIMPNNSENIAYQAARTLIFTGRNIANGYTESVLHHYRQVAKDMYAHEKQSTFINLQAREAS
ncbi:MAG: malate synthase G [Cellvibrionaceae bacterium]